MITAKKFCIKCSHENLSGRVDPKDLIEFAKLHVEACKKELAELVDKRLENESEIRAFLIDGSSVLKAYPIENIK